MGLPAQYVKPAASDSEEFAKNRETMNSCVGNGYHAPSAMLMFYCLFSLLQPVAPSPARPMYGMYEARLRNLGASSVLNDEPVASYPGLMSAPELAEAMRTQTSVHISNV